MRQILANQQINAFLTITWLQKGPLVVLYNFFWWINISIAFNTHIGKIFFRLLKIIVFNFMRLDIINKSTRKKTHICDKTELLPVKTSTKCIKSTNQHSFYTTGWIFYRCRICKLNPLFADVILEQKVSWLMTLKISCVTPPPLKIIEDEMYSS